MANRPSVEQEVKQYFDRKGICYHDHTSSYVELDFTVVLPNQSVFYLEVKEKRQVYNPGNWPEFAPGADLFILDDLTVRKCLGFAPRCGIIVRDLPGTRYVFFSVVDLTLMPRKRVNRPIRRNVGELKGKWLVNLQNGRAASSVEGALAHVAAYASDLGSILNDVHACYGDYVDEQLQEVGIVRRPGHWAVDVAATR